MDSSNQRISADILLEDAKFNQYHKLLNSCVMFYSFSYYQILVHRVRDWTDTVTDWNNFGSNFYISAQIPASDVKTKMMFLLGDGENKGGYNNKELSNGQKYKIYSRALTEVTSKVEILSIKCLRELKTKQLEKSYLAGHISEFRSCMCQLCC